MFAYTFGPSQIIVLLLLGVLLFGNRLPEVGRSVAKALREFQKAWHGIENEVVGTIRPAGPVLPGPRTPARVSTAVPLLHGVPSSSPSA